MKHAVIITSIIEISEKSIGYSPKRSVFSSFERLNQTLETISSIRRYIPNVYIFLVEGGSINYSSEFEGLVDKYIFVNRSRFNERFINSKNRGLGEIYLLLYTFGNFDFSEHKLIFKISGRYTMNDSFSIDDHSYNHFNFHKYKLTLSESSLLKKLILSNGIHTLFYSIDSKKICYFKKKLILSIFFLLIGFGLETALSITLKGDLNLLHTLGVEGRISVDGNYVKH